MKAKQLLEPLCQLVFNMQKIICSYLALFILFSVACDNGNREGKSPPLNFVFILADDHAVKAISAYGGDLIQTPNIDRIAKAGIRFDRAYVTNSICAPSRACILTGKLSHKNGQKTNHDVFDGNQTTFPKLLQLAGYQTAIVGKWHLKSQPTGFDYWNVLPDQGFYYNPDFNTMGDSARINGYATDLTADFAIDWLDKRGEREKPFFLFFNHKSPHRNWMPALRHLDTLANTVFEVPPAFYDDYKGRPAAATQEMHLAKHFYPWYDVKANNVPTTARDSALWKLVYSDRLTPEEKAIWEDKYQARNEAYKKGLEQGKDVQYLNFQAYMRDYLRCVMSLDESVGRMLDYLEAEGLDKNTVVIYASDQGFYLGEHGWFDKRWMYEESERMPLLISCPGNPQRGQASQDFIMNIDLAPTILDLAGATVPEGMQGRSFKKLLEGNALSDWRDAVYYHYYEYPIMTHVNPHYGIRTAQYKLIRFYGDVEGWELYDMEKDPHELNNIADQADFSEIQLKLKNQLIELQRKFEDTETIR